MPAEHSPVAKVAQQLTRALEAGEPDQLGALLHPDVRWGGPEETPETCHSRGEVLATYSALHASGVRAHVVSTQLFDAAVVLELALAGPGTGPDGPVPDLLFQTFALEDGRVVDIRGFPSADLAHRRAASPRDPR